MPWGVDLQKALMAASAEARALNGEEPLAEVTFLGKVLGELKKRSPAGDAAAFLVLAAEHDLPVPEVRVTRRNDCGGQSRAAALSENAPLQSPPRPARGKGPVSPLPSLPSAPTQAAAAARTRSSASWWAALPSVLPLCTLRCTASMVCSRQCPSALRL
jgi:hypothetical protein